MDLISPYSITEEPKTIGLGLSTKNTNDLEYSVSMNITEEEPTKKKSSKKKKEQLFSSPGHMVTETLDSAPKKEFNFIDTNEPYANKYKETDNILKSAIMQIDVSMAELNNDISYIRNSKLLKKKYDYLSMMQGAMGNLLGNKIAAARELNNTISKCQDFELKRYKENKAALAGEQDEDKKIMDMYQAFVNTPVSSGTPMLGPSMSDMTINNSGLITSTLGGNDIYSQYHNNMTPSQNMMHLDLNPDIKQVVVYNQETGARYFEVMNLATGEVVPNAEKHDSMFLEGVTIDIKNNIARNIDLGETYPLVVVGQPLLNEY